MYVIRLITSKYVGLYSLVIEQITYTYSLVIERMNIWSINSSTLFVIFKIEWYIYKYLYLQRNRPNTVKSNGPKYWSTTQAQWSRIQSKSLARLIKSLYIRFHNNFLYWVYYINVIVPKLYGHKKIQREHKIKYDISRVYKNSNNNSDCGVEKLLNYFTF